MSFAVIGNAEQIGTLFCGPQQHDEHCKGWRWHLYVADNDKRFAAVMAEVHRRRDERHARTIAQLAAE